MKARNFFKASGLAVLLATFLFAGCGKYEEGPGISLRSKTARVANVWKIDKYTVDGVEQDVTSLGDWSWEYTKDNKVTSTYVIAGQTTTDEGTWEFNDDKTELGVKGSTSTNFSYSKILKLKNKELWMTDPDSDTSSTKSEIRYIPAE